MDPKVRKVDYLRVSVTDKCNLRCVYCMPESGIDLKPHIEILRLEEMAKIIKLAASMGISKIRITGGEPLVRKGIISFIEEVANTPGIEDVSLTTNGILLKKYGKDLKQAGLDRVNISLDTLKPEKFKEITRIGNLQEVWSGIHEALKLELNPVKINVVVIRDFNYDEILEFVDLTSKLPIHIRFIELMPIGEGESMNSKNFVSAQEILKLIEEKYPVLPSTNINGAGPAKYISIAKHKGTIGFISAMSDHFCNKCNRLRLTAEGKIRPCLQSSKEIDIKTMLRYGASDEKLKEIIGEAIMGKPLQHTMNEEGWKQQNKKMYHIGG
ncbi:cyclic pyranopterin phosphate synthase [Desulfitispora alkaliphila]|uniref:GTP 3',8-cyclase MoaA n=1 Tax=Desulfitispora alkaliphila TaxID=622674 RepID=UPI003D237DB7